MAPRHADELFIFVELFSGPGGALGQICVPVRVPVRSFFERNYLRLR